MALEDGLVCLVNSTFKQVNSIVVRTLLKNPPKRFVKGVRSSGTAVIYFVKS